MTIAELRDYITRRKNNKKTPQKSKEVKMLVLVLGYALIPSSVDHAKHCFENEWSLVPLCNRIYLFLKYLSLK